jgi:hypothetical protein
MGRAVDADFGREMTTRLWFVNHFGKLRPTHYNTVIIMEF